MIQNQNQVYAIYFKIMKLFISGINDNFNQLIIALLTFFIILSMKEKLNE
jgi:hypothetical protein